MFKTILQRIFLSGKLKHTAKLIINAQYRSRYLTDKRFKNDYFQHETLTRFNRYPALFDQCRQYLNNVQNPHILSFGCSTGEEVCTLGEYLPGAHIMGVDINKWCLKQCTKKYPDERFIFCHRFSEQFLNSENFDAICCLAVFQRTESRRTNNEIAKEHTFEKFEAEIALLDTKLKRGGLLIIDNADFSFLDTHSSVAYRPLDFRRNQLLRVRPLFDRNNQKIADEQHMYRVFQKC